MLNDTRIAGGLNVDGNFFSSLLQASAQINRLFLQSGARRVNPRPNYDHIWTDHLKGWKLEVELKGAKPGTFTDTPLVYEALGVRDSLGQDGAYKYGTVGGQRGLEILSTYMSEFAKFVTEGKAAPGSLRNGGAQKYPEAVVARTGGGS